MHRKIIAMGAMLLMFSATTTAPVFAENGKDTARIEKLEERTRDLEARLAKVEGSTDKQMGMMKHGKDMKGNKMKMGMDNHPMGQMPQQVPQQNPGAQGAMPNGGASQQPGGGMGDM